MSIEVTRWPITAHLVLLVAALLEAGELSGGDVALPGEGGPQHVQEVGEHHQLLQLQRPVSRDVNGGSRILHSASWRRPILGIITDGQFG